MNLRERLEIRALVNLVVGVLERLVNLIIKLSPKTKIHTPVIKPKPSHPRPLKKVIENINNILPKPWRK
jgi:hypothetical protein